MTNPHLTLLEKAEVLLRPLSRKFVFVGGVSVSLHLDDPAVRVRPTKDVDFVVEATSYAQNALIEEELRSLGFVQNAGSDDPICRWHKDGLVLDMIPTNPAVLGFGESRWFEHGFESAGTYELPGEVEQSESPDFRIHTKGQRVIGIELRRYVHGEILRTQRSDGTLVYEKLDQGSPAKAKESFQERLYEHVIRELDKTCPGRFAIAIQPLSWGDLGNVGKLGNEILRIIQDHAPTTIGEHVSIGGEYWDWLARGRPCAASAGE